MPEVSKRVQGETCSILAQTPDEHQAYVQFDAEQAECQNSRCRW